MDLQKLKSDVIILQLTTNYLKVNNPDLVINDMKSLVNKIQSSLPGTKLGISHAPLQRNNTNMTYSNQNLAHDICLERDGVHLSRRGSSVLASNIRDMIRDLLAPQQK